jgi:superfamily II DNA or RNA helicase
MRATIKDYNKIKDLSMDELKRYCDETNGIVTADYFTNEDCTTPTPNHTGYHRHHLGEEFIPGLSKPEIAKTQSFEYQRASMLVNCTPLQHIEFHILIAESTPYAEVGRNGAYVLLAKYADSFDPEVVDAIEERLSKTGTLLAHNMDLYNDIKLSMARDNKALCILATGGGKTTTALQYAIDTDAKTLVLVPKNAIQYDWDSRKTRYPQIKKVMCYQSFAKITNVEEFMKDYDLVICDEVHHLAKGNTWTTNIIKILQDTPCALLGITAECKRSDNTKVANILFDGKCCKGLNTVEFLKSGVFWPISYVSTTLGVPELKLDPRCSFLQKDLDLALNNDPIVKLFKKYRPNMYKVKGITFVPRDSSPDKTGENFTMAKDLIRAAYGPDMPIFEINYKLGAKTCRQIKEDFEKAKYGFLIAVDMVSEGIHFPGINTVVILRNAQSPLVVNQQIGRLTRIKHAGEEDPECILFDIVNIIKTVDYRDIVRTVKAGLISAIKEMSSKSAAVIYDDQCERLYQVLERADAFMDKTVDLFSETCILD